MYYTSYARISSWNRIPITILLTTAVERRLYAFRANSNVFNRSEIGPRGVFVFVGSANNSHYMCSRGKNAGLAKPSRERIVCRAEFFAGPTEASEDCSRVGDGGGGGCEKNKVNGRRRTQTAVIPEERYISVFL